jgi:hypothetical protein
LKTTLAGWQHFLFKSRPENNSNTLAKTDLLLSPLMALADPLFCVFYFSPTTNTNSQSHFCFIDSDGLSLKD